MTNENTPDSAASVLSAGLGHMPRHPTLDECGAAGNGGTYSAAVYTEGGLPDTTDERARFEAYMRGHCWDTSKYDDRLHCYDTTTVRMLYGVWRDRGSLPTVWPNALGEGRERGILREASSGEAATSTDGLGVAVSPAPTFGKE